mmetsp:Transcript_9493/g.33068  ORF Transcript_9493/g.33068 Transcript_9493/m.33068 type:complete len:297 (-) Transcript_9493:358-1248(-)
MFFTRSSASSFFVLFSSIPDSLRLTTFSGSPCSWRNCCSAVAAACFAGSTSSFAFWTRGAAAATSSLAFWSLSSRPPGTFVSSFFMLLYTCSSSNLFAGSGSAWNSAFFLIISDFCLSTAASASAFALSASSFFCSASLSFSSFAASAVLKPFNTSFAASCASTFACNSVRFCLAASSWVWFFCTAASVSSPSVSKRSSLFLACSCSAFNFRLFLLSSLSVAASKSACCLALSSWSFWICCWSATFARCFLVKYAPSSGNGFSFSGFPSWRSLSFTASCASRASSAAFCARSTFVS